MCNSADSVLLFIVGIAVGLAISMIVYVLYIQYQEKIKKEAEK
jgi:hypothetical protein